MGAEGVLLARGSVSVAVRAEGLKVGLYYSLVDWHHPDCPAAGDRQHPLRHKPDSQARDVQCDWSRYVAYPHGQVEELCSHYGRIDSLVFDFSYWDYAGEKWGATELLRKIRALQPHCLVNDRLGNEPRKRVPRPAYAGDYEQTEQNIPRECLRDDAGKPMPWEGWFTLTNSWGYSATDNLWKTPAAIIPDLKKGTRPRAAPLNDRMSSRQIGYALPACDPSRVAVIFASA